MGKALDILVRIKNLTDSTVAVARSVVPPRGLSPIKAKKLKDIESIIKAADAGTIEILSPDESSLRVLGNLTNENTGKLELPEETLELGGAEVDSVPLGEQASGEDVPPSGSETPPVDVQGLDEGKSQEDTEKASDEDTASTPVEVKPVDESDKKDEETDVESTQNETLDLGEDEEAAQEPAAKPKRQSRAKN